MEVFSKYFARLVAANASQIFSRDSRSVANASGNYHLLVQEMRKLSHDFKQARQVAESIETGTEDVFRDFDLSTFMEHFQLDALEKTALALAFKLGSRPDLKTKADAILSTNFPSFLNILSHPDGEHADLNPDFIAELIDRFIQFHPPNFGSVVKRELEHKVHCRYGQSPESKPPPSQVLAALDLMRLLADNKPQAALAVYIQRTGPNFTTDEETCVSYLQNRLSNIHLSEDQVAIALTYTTISLTMRHDPSVLVAALRRVLPSGFHWASVVACFDQPSARITSDQFLRLYHALLPIALDDSDFNIQCLWGGEWENPEAQLSFICAFASLTPEQLDATTIPRLEPTFTVMDYAHSSPAIRQQVDYAVRHPLVSKAALSAVFNVALHNMHASQSSEARRLFQDVVVPNLSIFVVSAFGVEKPWPTMAEETLVSLFDGFISRTPEADFVLDSLWRKDKLWVKNRLIDNHALKPMSLPTLYQIAVHRGWLHDLVDLPNGFGLDLTAFAHAEGEMDLHQWAQRFSNRSEEFARAVLQFLMIKASLELQYQRSSGDPSFIKTTTTLQVKTVSAMLQILQDMSPKTPYPELILVQRQCITAYPRLINYGEGFDDIIDANGRNGNALPQQANTRMEEHYKDMYGQKVEVKNIVDTLARYKRSKDPLEQDVFACMIHGLFDEYSHYVDYPLEALATTAVLFGGIISHKLISDLPLQIGLGMILEAVRDHNPEEPMYKFGLQALMQLFSRLREWPGFCVQLHQISGLQGTEAWKQADAVVRELEADGATAVRSGDDSPSHPHAVGGNPLTNGGLDDGSTAEQHFPPFTSVNVDPPPAGIIFEEPNDDTQGKIQFVLNNVTDNTVQTQFKDLREMLELKHQQWFASHLVEERAKMMPNYHDVYVKLVDLFEDKALFAEVLRETYISVARMLNSERTLQNSTDRTHLKNLGGWLGLLTLARDKPIRHRNIAFKELLIEAHDTKRLIFVIPFVCKVLIQGVTSNVFRPPNPWLMDIIYLLIELYHNAELKLNLKFEIEVLCKGLNLDHKAIKPSGEILNRVPVSSVMEIAAAETLDAFDNLTLNGLPASHASLPVIPDLGPSITLPATDVVTPQKLHEIVRQALTRALQDIIQPVVDRSATIAAISTHQIVHKDFATEPDENRVCSAATTMVKTAAGSLALVTSKEPLRANFANYLRSYAAEVQGGLPEGVMLLCVNSNLDLASNIIAKSAEERAVADIDEMLEGEREARRRHRANRPNEPYVDSGLSRWAMTIPHPFKLQPSIVGLNAEQMAIYEDFDRPSRASAAAAPPSLMPAASDARSMANEVLLDQFNPTPSLPTPAETAVSHGLSAQLQHFSQGVLSNGRLAAPGQLDPEAFSDRVNKLLESLASNAAGSSEQHFADLPRASTMLDLIDALVQLIIKTQQSSEDLAAQAATWIADFIFKHALQANTLLLESLVHVLDTIRKIVGPTTSQHIRDLFHQHPHSASLSLPLIAALLGTDLLDWRIVDITMAKALQQRKDGSIEFLEQLMDLTLLNDNPLALYVDFVRSLEEAWTWITEDPDVPGGQSFKSKILAPPPALPPHLTPAEVRAIELEHRDYVFDEWIHLCNNPAASDKAAKIFIQQLTSNRVIKDRDDFLIFVRQAIDKSVGRFEQHFAVFRNLTDSYQAIDALVKMIGFFLNACDDGGEAKSARTTLLDSVLAIGVLVLNDHHYKRGENFNQRVFFRFFSMLLHHVAASEELTNDDRERMLPKFAARISDLNPTQHPGFLFGWMALIGHHGLVSTILTLPNEAGWSSYTKLLQQLLSYLGELLKPVEVSDLAKEIYQATLKLLAVLYHDFPEYLAANHVQLLQSLPPHAVQLQNMILAASPSSAKLVDPFQQGLKIDRVPGIRDAPRSTFDAATQLRRAGLLEILDQTLRSGPTEDTIAQISHVINKPQDGATAFGFTPVGVDRQVIDSVVIYIGQYAINRAASKSDGTVFVPGASDIKTLFLLVTESSAESRYYLLSAMANELRYPNAMTYYFSRALLDIFGHDMSDPEETDTRQQIVRILLERLVGYFPQSWGLVVAALELVKNDKYNFFELPFIKAAPEVQRLFEEKLLKPTPF